MLGTAVCSCSTIHRLMQTFGLYWWIECSWWTKNCFLLWRKDDVETQKHQAVTLMFTACGKWLARNVIKEKQNKTHIWKSEIYFLIKRSSFHRVTLYDAHYQRVTETACFPLCVTVKDQSADLNVFDQQQFFHLYFHWLTVQKLQLSNQVKPEVSCMC